MFNDNSYEAWEIRRYRQEGRIVHGGSLLGSSLHGAHSLSHGSDRFLGSHTVDSIVLL